MEQTSQLHVTEPLPYFNDHWFNKVAYIFNRISSMV